MTLLTKIKNGDQVAFQEAYNQFHMRLYHFFVQRTRSTEVANDLTQQCFIKLWKLRHTLSEAHTLNTRFFTIANSIFIDYLRSQAVERKYLGQLQDDYGEHLSTKSCCQTNYASSDYLNAAPDHLPPGGKKLFLLKIAQGYSIRNIAKQLSVSVNMVEEHYSIALTHVRSLFIVLKSQQTSIACRLIKKTIFIYYSVWINKSSVPERF